MFFLNATSFFHCVELPSVITCLTGWFLQAESCAGTSISVKGCLHMMVGPAQEPGARWCRIVSVFSAYRYSVRQASFDPKRGRRWRKPRPTKRARKRGFCFSPLPRWIELSRALGTLSCPGLEDRPRQAGPATSTSAYEPCLNFRSEALSRDFTYSALCKDF